MRFFFFILEQLGIHGKLIRTYGSGYPGLGGRGVTGRGFPFYFWPIAWGGLAGLGAAAYLHSTEVRSGGNLPFLVAEPI